jgi:putative copper export protein/methionine-rich copper-binding protein CopC
LRLAVRGPAGALLALAGLLLHPATASAHQRLLDTAPARDDVVAEAPRELRLRFVEPVQLAFTTVVLLGPGGAAVRLGAARLHPDSATVLVVPIDGPLHAGAHVVQWATASRDGHPVRGEFGFAIAEGAAGFAADHAAHPGGEFGAGVVAPGQPPPPPEHHAPFAAAGGFQADAPAYVLVRWANYLGILGVIGTVVFRLLVLGYLRRRRVAAWEALLGDAARRAATVGLAFGVLALVTALGRLYAQSLAMHGPAFALDAERVLMMLRRTVWGWGWLLQVGAAGAAVLAFAVARRVAAPPAPAAAGPAATAPATAAGAWTGAALAAAALALTPALSGHAAALTGTVGRLAIATHTLHVLAAAGWIGSLFVLLAAGVPAALASGAARGDAVAHLVRAFSPTALLFAGVLMASGVFAAFLHSSSLDALVASRYGSLLLLKVAIFLLVFGIGAYNFLRVRPGLGGDVSTRRLKQSAAAELLVAAAVLLVTATLVATARPYEEDERHAAGGADAAPQTQTHTTEVTDP